MRFQTQRCRVAAPRSSEDKAWHVLFTCTVVPSGACRPGSDVGTVRCANCPVCKVPAVGRVYGAMYMATQCNIPKRCVGGGWRELYAR